MKSSHLPSGMVSSRRSRACSDERRTACTSASILCAVRAKQRRQVRSSLVVYQWSKREAWEYVGHATLGQREMAGMQCLM